MILTYEMPNIEPSGIAMGTDDSLMFVTYPGGFIASIKYPLQNPLEFHEYHIHYSDISKVTKNLRISSNPTNIIQSSIPPP